MSSNELNKTMLFTSPNRYSALDETANDNVDLPESIYQGLTDTTIPTSMKVSLPSPIFLSKAY